MFAGFSAMQLMTCLVEISPAEFLGTRLLHTQPCPDGAWFPPQVPPDLLVQATLEIISYTAASADLRQRLADLPPVPLRAIAIVEFSL